ncbi:MAG: translation elongation factor Ts [Candidatus Sumerlaeia bacterium]|nr:translation elongation factor Ts [Candidatus Sumerlaeia bacterium]
MSTTITAKMVADLRAQTGAGMSDCKKALEEAQGNLEEAVKVLRERGILKAAKRADRNATEGLIGVQISADHKTGALVVLNCETDFAARNDRFTAALEEYKQAALAAATSDLDTFLAAKTASGATVKESLDSMTAVIGEKIEISGVHFEGGDVVTGYIHPPGKIAVLLTGTGAGLSGDTAAKAGAILREVGMHVAAYAPRFLDASAIDEATIASEREIAKNIALNEGKPAAMVDKIVDGKMKKFAAENALLLQAFAKDESVTVGQFIENEAKKAGFQLKLTAFKRVAIGA